MEPDLILQTINQYLAAWNTVDITERTVLLSECFATNGIYIDPHAGTKNGVAEMQALIEEFRSKFPHRLERTGNIDILNNTFKVPWRLIDETAGILSSGTFDGELDANARIIRLTVSLNNN